MYITFVALASMGNDMWSIGKSTADSTFVTSAVKCTHVKLVQLFKRIVAMLCR